MTTMDDIAKGWLVRVAADHYWRVAHWYDFEDLLQDGHMIWWFVVQRYQTEPGRIRSRQHIMRLFKTSFLNHIHQLANRRTRNLCEELVLDIMDRGAFVFADGDEVWDPWGILNLAHDVAAVDRFVLEAPEELRALLIKLINNGWSSLSRFRLDGTRDTLNARFCRMVGVDPNERDLAAELYAYLKL